MGQTGLVDRAQFDPVRFSQTGEFLSQFVVGVLGALVITSEYATGSIRTTLATTSSVPPCWPPSCWSSAVVLVVAR